MLLYETSARLYSKFILITPLWYYITISISGKRNTSQKTAPSHLNKYLLKISKSCPENISGFIPNV